MTTRIFVTEELDLVVDTDGPGASRGLADRDTVRERNAEVLAALRDFAAASGGDLTDLNVAIAYGTLSYSEAEGIGQAK